MNDSDRWGIADIPNLSGKTAVVTGASSGLGLETARILALKGAKTVVTARNELKLAAAARSIRESSGCDVETRLLDVADLGSIERFSSQMSGQLESIDLLINNAGIMLVPQGETVDGFELHLGTNHIGHFALTGRLLPLLEAADSARVVSVASLAHNGAEIDFDKLFYEDGGYEPMLAYRRSKLANLLFAYELDRRLRAHESSITSVAAHPGLSNTNLAGHLAHKWWWKFTRPVVGLFVQDAEDGALPTLRAATDPAVKGGDYYGPGGKREASGPPMLVESSRLSHDRAVAERLWERSGELTGVRFL